MVDVDARDLLERFLRFIPTGTVAAFAGVAAVAGSYAAVGFNPGFVVAPIASFLTDSIPDAVISFARLRLGSLGQQLNLILAFATGISLFGTFGLLGIAVSRRVPTAGPLFSLALGWATAFGLTGAPLFALAAAVPCAGVVALAEVIRRYPEVDPETDAHGRREVLGAAAGALGLSAVSYVVGSGKSTGSTAGLAEVGLPASDVEEINGLLAEAEEMSLGVDGIEPLVSEDFYNIDIRNIDPDVDESEWTLSVTGEVENEVTLTYDELVSMEAEHRFNTLRCVGEELNGHKMDNALWTGIPIWDLVQEAGPRSGCECVMLRGEDGYFEEFPIDAMQDGLLAYGMNGDVLPRAHGYPARALIPGHWGEINVKWINEIEVLDEEADGYWESRGWKGTGPVKTVAKIHAVNDIGDGRREIAGHAYAGTRGIQTVEVSVDGGDTWEEAELSDPLPETAGEPPEEAGETSFGEDVWRQWRYEYDPEAEGAGPMVTARARDGNGDLQPEDESDAFPSGPSGWVTRQVEMS